MPTPPTSEERMDRVEKLLGKLSQQLDSPAPVIPEDNNSSRFG